MPLSSPRLDDIETGSVSDVKRDSVAKYFLLCIWLSVAAWFLINKLLQLMYLKRIVQDAIPLYFVRPEMRFKLNEIKCFVHDSITIPFIYGIKKPVVVLPSTYQNWNGDQFDAVIKHELYHFKRKDLWKLWLSYLVYSLYWFHPLFFWMMVKHKKLIELSCDQQLVRERMVEPKAYAKTLVNVAQYQLNSSALSMSSQSYEILKERVVCIMNADSKHSKWYRISKSLFMSIIMCVFVAACVRVNQEKYVDPEALIQFISHDLKSIRHDGLPSNTLQITSFYDGVSDENAYLSFELISQSGEEKTWLNLGPLVKFNQQVQTWELSLIGSSRPTGVIKINGIVPDGMVDGVAVGLLWSDDQGKIKLMRSSSHVVADEPNLICSWPLAFRVMDFRRWAPQVSSHKAEVVRRMICGSQLLPEGVHTLL